MRSRYLDRTQNLLLLVLVALYITTLIEIAANINDPYLWFDEAGQFWIAKGLNHDSDPLQAPGPVRDVIANNASYNYDPGGFSILLHFWTTISNSYLWMRSLPFLFFVATSLLLIYLAYERTTNIVIGLAMGSVPFLVPTIVRSALEIRAYSMEYLGVVTGVAGLYALRLRLSSARILVVSCIFSIFLTSRYSIIVVLFAVSLCVMGLIVRSGFRLWHKMQAAVLYAVPLMISLAYVYVFALRVQDPYLKPLSYLPYLSDDWTVLFKSDENLLYLWVVALLTVALVWVSINRRHVLHEYTALLFVAVASNAIFVALSFWGAYPWAPLSRYGLPYLVITLVGGSSILGGVGAMAYQRARNLATVGIIALVVLSMYLNKGYQGVRADTAQIFRCLGSVDFASYHQVYVDRWASPSIKYLFEYGSFVGLSAGVYPSRLHFAKALPHRLLLLGTNNSNYFRTQPKMNDLLGYDLLITPELYNSGGNDKWTALDGCDRWVFVRARSVEQ